MPLFVYNKSSVAKVLSGTNITVSALSSVNVTSELKDKTVSERMALETQKGTSLIYKWSGVAEYETFPLRTIDINQEFDIVSLKTLVTELSDKLNNEANCHRICCRAMYGDMLLGVSGDRDVSAAQLNAAESGTFKKTFVTTLKTSQGEPHSWINGDLLLTATENVVASGVNAPTIAPSSPKWNCGRSIVTVTFDTDVGVEKIYANGDSVSVDVQVASDDKLLGYTVSGITQSFNIVV